MIVCGGGFGNAWTFGGIEGEISLGGEVGSSVVAVGAALVEVVGSVVDVVTVERVSGPEGGLRSRCG